MAEAQKQLNSIGYAITSLRERVGKLNSSNQLVFAFIAVVTIAGFWLVAQAGNLATLETIDFYGQAASVRSSLSATERALDQVTAKLGDKDRKLPETAAALQGITAMMVESRDLLKRLPEALPEPGKTNDTDRQRVMVASIVIRLTTALLLGFLIQVMLNVYRYNARLIAFYEARADALLLAGETDAATLERTAKLLFPDKLELEKNPEPPAKQVLEMLKQLTNLSRQKVEENKGEGSEGEGSKGEGHEPPRSQSRGTPGRRTPRR